MITEENTKDQIDYSNKVTERILQLIDECKLIYSDELLIISHLNKRYNPVTIAKYAELSDKPFITIQRQFKAKKLSGINFGNVDFIYNKFN